MSPTFLAYIIVFSTGVGFILNLFLLRFPRLVQVLSCLSVALSFLALVGFWLSLNPNLNFSIDILSWMKANQFRVNWGISLDNFTFVMCIIVTFVSFWVHVYSIGYMAHDAQRARFMAYLNLFTFMMVLLITSPNMAQMFVGWEGVGLASYLLIGFWHHRSRAGTAAMKAFIVNRLGDMALILGICALFVQFETLDFSLIVLKVSGQIGQTFEVLGYKIPTLEMIAGLFFIGAMAKSAQIGLHVWLPDAMEGPTPVSALIHAATMVTAGVFLIVNLSPLYECTPYVRQVMIVVGTTTSFFAAVVALTQNDIKRIVAYSTSSQLGYMILACGCSAYSAAIFHLITHAFFKALLFLGVGSIIHAMSDEQDIQKMGGLARLIPKTYAFMWIGSLALSGIPWLSGYYSKDLILESIESSGHSWALFFALITVVLTAFYSMRLLWFVFHGKMRADEQVAAHIHESPFSMILPLFILALGAIFGGWLGRYWLIQEQGGFSWLGSIVQVPFSVHPVPSWLHYGATVLAMVGMTGVVLYQYPALINRLSQTWVYRFAFHKGYFDEVYNFLFVRSAFWLGKILWHQVDQKTLDRLGPDAAARLSLDLSRKNAFLQTGSLYDYVVVMLLSIVVLVGYCFCRFYGPWLWHGLLHQF